MRVEDNRWGRRHCCHEERLTPKDEDGDDATEERSSETGKRNKARVNEKNTVWLESVGVKKEV